MSYSAYSSSDDLRKKKRRRQVYAILSLMFIIWTTYRLITLVQAHRDAIVQLKTMEHKIKKSEEKLTTLQQDLKRLNDPEYIEQRARRDQGMIRPGEQSIQQLKK